MQEVTPQVITQVTSTGYEFIGMNDAIAYLQDMHAFDVSSNAELKIAKDRRSTANKFIKQVKDARKAVIELFNNGLDEAYPELNMIVELAEDTVAEFDAEIKPYIASKKDERLEKAQVLIDEISCNYEQDPFKAPSDYANEEYWTAKGNISSKLEKRIVADVLNEKYRLEQESRVEQIKTAKSLDFKNDIASIINSIDKEMIYSGNDVIKMLMPLRKYVGD